MAFNLGAFAGGLAQGGANTYFKMGEMQRQEEELAMRKQEAAYQEELRNQERELNKITALTLGSGDKRMVADQSTVNQGYEGADGPAATGYKEVAYTPQQQMADFKQRALAAGVPLQKVTAVSGAHRAEKYAEKEELALDFNNQVMSDVKANPNDLGAVFKKHFEPLYNEGKLPGLNDGSKVELIPDGKGGQSMLFKDAKGKPTQPPVPLDIHAMEAITKKWGNLMMASSSPANYWKSRDEDLKGRQVGAAEKTADAHIMSAKAAWANAGTAAEAAKYKNQYWEAAAKKMGQTKADDMKEAVSVQADLIQKADPKISRPEAELKAANKLLHSAEDKASVVTAEQVQKFIDSPEGDRIKFKQVNGRKVPRTPEEVQTEALRLLQLRTPTTGGIPMGGAKDNRLEQAWKHATDEDFQ